jgi:DNA-binding NarL/FixJ family response regulator
MPKVQVFRLSERERKVALLLGEGWRIGEVAKRLGWSQKTVERRNYEIREKLRTIIVRSRMGV